MPYKKIKIVVAGGQPLFRQGICAAIVPHPDMEVISIIENSCASVEKFKKLKPDVIIIDGLLPGCAERECAAIIIAVAPAKVIILSAIPSFDCACRMFGLGAAGYLLKNCAPEEVLGAVRLVLEGKNYLSQQIARQGYSMRIPAGQYNHTQKLTPREKEVLSFITAGHTVKQIAGCMGILSSTVITYKKRIRKKLQINNSIDLIKYAVRNGLASFD